MSAAFKICRGITAREDLKVLMDGIERMQVVQINLQEHDDPQQIVTVSRQSACRSTGLKVRKGTILSFVPLTRTIHGDRDLAPGRRHRNRTRSRTTGNEQWAAAGTSQPRVAGWLSAEWT